ncbi:MAG TPA: 30S ribosomal protein S20 [Candidatus Saccharimonas sp.]|nr:30S ribosomal protein S20 [Candidatus Saccharimonas sp.]
MPIIKSAMKRAKQALVRRSHNLQVKRAVKQDSQAVHAALAAGNAADIQTALAAAYSEIDRAVKKGALHKNTAARRKSQLAHVVAKAAGTEPVAAETKTTKGAGKSATKTVTKKAATKPTAKTAGKAAAKPTPKAAVKKAPAKAKKASDTKE